MRRTTRHNEAGFTLLEVMIAAFTFALSGTLILSLGFNVRNFEDQEQRQNKMEREASLVLDYMTRDIQSSGAVSPDFAGSLTSPSILILKMPEYDSLGITITNSFNYVVYEQSPDQDMVIRTVYDDKAGTTVLDQIPIQANGAYIECYVDSNPWYTLTAEAFADTIRIYVNMQDTRNSKYQRDFYITTTPRNHMK